MSAHSILFCCYTTFNYVMPVWWWIDKWCYHSTWQAIFFLYLYSFVHLWWWTKNMYYIKMYNIISNTSEFCTQVEYHHQPPTPPHSSASYADNLRKTTNKTGNEISRRAFPYSKNLPTKIWIFRSHTDALNLFYVYNVYKHSGALCAGENSAT